MGHVKYQRQRALASRMESTQKIQISGTPKDIGLRKSKQPIKTTDLELKESGNITIVTSKSEFNNSTR